MARSDQGTPKPAAPQASEDKKAPSAPPKPGKSGTIFTDYASL